VLSILLNVQQYVDKFTNQIRNTRN